MRLINLINIILLAPILVSNCKNASGIPKEDPSYIFLKYKTTMCMGTCPVYNLEISRNGKCSYAGKENVDNIGDYIGRISEDEVAELEKLFTEIDFINLVDEKNIKTVGIKTLDLPTKYIYYNNGEQTRNLKYTYPKNKDIEKIIQHINDLTQKINWIQN